MFRAVGMAAGFVFGGELHHFDARPVWIVRIQAVFPVAADFWTIECSQAVEAKLGRSIVNVSHAKGEMILHSKLFMIGIGRNVEHVFDPVGAVGNLEFVPVNAVILEPAVPVEAKSQEINIETILSRQVFDYKTRMDQVGTDLLRRRPVSDFRGNSMYEGNGITFRVPDSEGS